MIVIIILFLSIIDVIYFILFHFISYYSYYYDFCLRVMCGVYASPHIFIFFLSFSMIYILYSKCSFMSRINHFFVIIVYTIIVIIITILFFQHYQSLGENSAYEFEQHRLPLPIDYFG